MDSYPDNAALATWGSGTQPSKARQRGDVVVRDASPWAATVRALLHHYETVGFTGAPRVVGSGVTPDGLDAVTWVEGTSPHPHAWPDEALPALGELLRRVHDAGATFTPPPGARWQPLFSRTLPGTRPVIGHGDVGPWNVLAQPGGGCALIDWEFAGPVDAVWELTQTAWLNAQLHDDDIAESHDLPAPAVRAHQVRLLLDGYGVARADRVGFVDKLIEFTVRAARAEAVDQRVTADSPAVTATGFPILWAITWRTRSAAWMLATTGHLRSRRPGGDRPRAADRALLDRAPRGRMDGPRPPLHRRRPAPAARRRRPLGHPGPEQPHPGPAAGPRR